jgi:hypothetical protein
MKLLIVSGMMDTEAIRIIDVDHNNSSINYDAQESQTAPGIAQTNVWLEYQFRA